MPPYRLRIPPPGWPICSETPLLCTHLRKHNGSWVGTLKLTFERGSVGHGTISTICFACLPSACYGRQFFRRFCFIFHQVPSRVLPRSEMRGQQGARQ